MINFFFCIRCKIIILLKQKIYFRWFASRGGKLHSYISIYATYPPKKIFILHHRRRRLNQFGEYSLSLHFPLIPIILFLYFIILIESL